MSSSVDARVVPPNPSPRRVFAERLTALFEVAGKPTLRVVAAAASGRTGSGGRGSVSLQRISDWRSGKAIPADFDSLLPVLVTLIERARTRGGDAAPELVSLAAWRRLWRAAQDWDPNSEAVCPYRGLASYRREDSACFFGRTAATADLVELVRGAADTPSPGPIVLMGASGAGKSSLLFAGVVPALQALRPWRIAVMTPGARPAKTLSELLVDLAGTPPDLVVVDQFEETFTNCLDEVERTEFLSGVAELAAAGRCVVLLAVRADFFPQCLAYPILADALNTRSYSLGPMRTEELTEAVDGPARAAGLKVDPGLVELVVTELNGLAGDHGRNPGSLPLLSHVMTQTWAHREGTRLTVAGYRKAGGVAGSVTATAEHAWQRLSTPERTAARELLMGLVNVGSDGPDTRRRVPRAELLSGATESVAAQTALDLLIDTRLITADAAGTDGEIVCFTHEIVLQVWPRLRGWIDAGRVDLLERQRIGRDAADWDTAGRNSALLYRGVRLRAAERAAPAAAGLVEDFLTAARAARSRNRRAVLATRAALALLGVVILVLGIAAYAQTRLSDQVRRNADVVAILAEADTVRSTDPSLSAQLELAADRIHPGDPDIRARLLRTQNLPLGAPLPGPDGEVHQVTYRPDGGLLAAAGDDGTIRLWNVADPSRPAAAGTPLNCGKPVTATEFAPDGRLLAAACGDRIQLWDLADPAHPAPLAALAGAVTGLAFGPDGHTLATADDTAVTLWNVENPRAPLRSAGWVPGSGRIVSIGYLPAGQLVTAGPHQVEIWAPGTTPTRLGSPITVPGPEIRATALSRDGSTLATGGSDTPDPGTGATGTTVLLWNLEDPAAPVQSGTPLTPAADSGLRALAFDPAGGVLAVADQNRVTLWSVGDRAHPATLGEPLTAPSPPCPHPTWVQSCLDSPSTVAFGADGLTITVGGALGGLRLWSPAPAVVGGRLGRLTDLAEVGAGGTMLTSAAGGRLDLWDIHDRRRVSLLADLGPGPAAGSESTPAISQDGSLAIMPDAPDPGLRLVDISDPAQIRVMAHFPEALVAGFAGRTLVEGLAGQRVRLWDLADPAHPRVTTAPTRVSPESAGPVMGLANLAGKLLVTLAPELNSLGQPEPTIKIWDVSQPGEAREIQRIPSEPDRPFTWFVPAPDGRSLVTVAGNTVRVWDIGEPGRARPLGDPIIGHALDIRSADFDRDGTVLATSASDSTVRLWDFRDPAHLRPIGQSITLPGHLPWNLAFDPAAERLIGVGGLGASIWDLSEDAARQRICAVTRGVLTPQVWAEHLPHLDYRPPCADR